MTSCPVCHHVSSRFCVVDDFEYFECGDCGIIYIEPNVILRIDSGEPIIEYRNDYWQMEAEAAEERARGAGILRFAESIFLCRTPVKTAIDIGTGTGRLLDHFQTLLPKNHVHIWGCELFPPKNRTSSSRYIEGTIGALNHMKFDAGMCMEVIEHLTPAMLSSMLKEIADRSSLGACYLFNTGLADYVKLEDRSYLDPTHRGHIIAWTVPAIERLAAPFGLRATALPGRRWAFIVEKERSPEAIEARLWNPLKENLTFLNDGRPGASLLATAAAESLRGYFNADRADRMAVWAHELDQRIKVLTSSNLRHNQSSDPTA